MTILGDRLERAVLDLAAEGRLDEFVQGRIERENALDLEERNELRDLRRMADYFNRRCWLCERMCHGEIKMFAGWKLRVCDRCWDATLDRAYEQIIREPSDTTWPGSTAMAKAAAGTGGMRHDLPPIDDRDLYFATSVLTGDLIKIGISANVPRRMRDLHAQAILVLARCGHREREIHNRFADLRVQGEWFRPDARLHAFIEELRAADQRLRAA